MSSHEIVVRVVRKTREALDINSYELAASDASGLPGFEAGAHIDVHLPNGLTRQYSLCGHPQQAGRYRIAVLRDPKTRGGSQAVHDLIHEGDELRIGMPRNLFPLQKSGGHSLLLAGGIGVTPLLAMAYHLHREGRPFELHYFTRSRDRAAFMAELQASGLAAQVFFHFDDEPDASQKPVAELLAAMDGATHLYTCGPAGFLNHVLDSARALGVPDARVHYETFAAAAPVSGGSFEVRIQSTGQKVVVGPDETVVAAVARLGIEIAVSCEQGICGTCLTRVVEGLPDHQDQYLTEAEQAANDQFTPCCSRSKSACLVLDL